MSAFLLRSGYIKSRVSKKMSQPPLLKIRLRLMKSILMLIVIKLVPLDKVISIFNFSLNSPSFFKG